jgi:DNA-binding transcriptional ArsR family regulator
MSSIEGSHPAITLARVDPELDTILRVLESRHRRAILYQLVEAETDVVDVDELVDAELARYPHASRGAVTAELYHVQLPKLDQAGWIEYDFRSGTVRFRPECAPTAVLEWRRATESGA